MHAFLIRDVEQDQQISLETCRPTGSRKYRSSLIDFRGSEMPINCLACDRRGVACMKSPDSTRCSECVRRKVTCRFEGPNAAEMVRAYRDSQKLREALRVAERAEEEMRARVLRLRQQNRILDARISEMIRRGCESLDEMDRADEEAREDALAQVIREPHAVPEGGFERDPIDLSGVDMDALLVSGSGSGS